MDPCFACHGAGWKFGPDRFIGTNEGTGLSAYVSGPKIYCDCPRGRQERIRDERVEPAIPLPTMPKIRKTFIF